MKKLIVSIIMVAFLGTIISAQFNSGSKMVGASSSFDFGYVHDKVILESSHKYLNIDLSARAAYFVMNGWAIGGDIGLYYDQSKYGDSPASGYWSLLLGPFTRYYYKSIGIFRSFGEFNAGLMLNGGDNYGGIGLYNGVGVGVALFLADNFALESKIGYVFEYSRDEVEQFHTNFGVDFNIGFSFFFNSLLQD